MAKTIANRIMPLFLIVVLLFGAAPLTVSAGGPEITIQPGGVPPSGSGGDVTIEPTNLGNSTPPDSSAPDGGGEDSSSVPSDEEASSTEAEDTTALDGITVLMEAGGVGTMSTGTLTLHSFDAYQWNFEYPRGGVSMHPWYIAEIDGTLAYCLEPTNPATTSGSYGTITYGALSSSQRYAIGYALLYGAQDMSNPLFHMATQVVIWEIVFGYMELEGFTSANSTVYNATIGYNTGAAAYYTQITEAMRNHVEIPSFTHFFAGSAPTHKVPGRGSEYKTDLVNTNPRCTLADFNFPSTGTVKFVKENEILHVTSTGKLNGDVLYSAYKSSIGHTESLVFWGSGDEQVRCTAGVLDPVPAHFKLLTEELSQYYIVIEKKQEGTNIPLSGAQFHIRHSEKGEIGTYTTDGSGKVTVNVPWQGTYICTEVVPPDNHLLDENPVKYIVISTDKPYGTLTYHNKPFSKGLEIQKIDAVTREPVAGVVFRVSWEGGFRSQSVTTNAAGIARLADLEPGFYEVRELSCPPGYILNDTPQTIELKYGEIARVVFENTPKPGLSVQKIDSVTGLGMEGVEFTVEKVSGERIGTYVSDSGGYFFIPDITEEQYVVIRETKTLPGYRIDTAEKLVKLEFGKLNKVVFTNSPWPYLVILKVDEASKKPLPDAVFKVTGADGKEIGTFTTDHEGKIVLTEVDAQVVTVQEVTAPAGFVLNDRVFEVELRWGCTTTFTFKNTPIDITVEVEKRGPVEALPGQEIEYTFRNIANNSTVPLDDFYWRDLLPTDAVRLVSIQTGTWNEELTYQIVYRTNLKESWFVLKDGLLTSVNHKLDCSAQVLGLASNEYVTEFKFLFGRVKPGFHEEKGPTLVCRVLADLPDGYQFTNRTDVGGRYGDKWTYDKDGWTTVVILTTDKGKLPKTGVWV